MKFSVYDHNTETRPPAYFLKLSKFAFDEVVGDLENKLLYSSTMSMIYLGALRVSECVQRLVSANFHHDKSAEGFPFLICDNVPNLKHQGGVKTVAIFEDDPIAQPILIYLQTMASYPAQVGLFDLSRFTPLNVVKRYTGNEGWTHWLRSQRISWLSSFLTPFELDAVGGWGGKKPKNPRDRYIHRQWMDYADKVAHATLNYWRANPLDPMMQEWLESLSGKEKKK